MCMKVYEGLPNTLYYNIPRIMQVQTEVGRKKQAAGQVPKVVLEVALQVDKWEVAMGSSNGDDQGGKRRIGTVKWR